uniref:Putative secreted protein n=1 Tax=Anopheles marajoara TaxID=58244 RepID=A0A2M4CEA2_9DIPT
MLTFFISSLSLSLSLSFCSTHHAHSLAHYDDTFLIESMFFSLLISAHAATERHTLQNTLIDSDFHDSTLG